MWIDKFGKTNNTNNKERFTNEFWEEFSVLDQLEGQNSEIENVSRKMTEEELTMEKEVRVIQEGLLEEVRMEEMEKKEEIG